MAVDHAQNRAMEFAMFLTLPAAIALAVVPGPIIQVLFERGQFTADATHMTAMALAAYAFGLPAFVLNKVLSPDFFAREDTKTPMQFATIGMIINVGGSLLLFPFLQHVGHRHRHHGGGLDQRPSARHYSVASWPLPCR